MWSTWLVLSLLAPAHAAGMEGALRPPTPYAVSGPRTEGRLEGFHALEVDPEALADGLGRPRVGRIPSIAAFDEDPATMLLGFMPVVHLGVDRERLAELGLSLEDLSAALPEGRRREVSRDGLDLSVLFVGHAEVAAPAALLEELASLTVATADGRTLPLCDLTDPWIGARDELPPSTSPRPGPPGQPSSTPVIETLPPPSAPVRGDLVIHNPARVWTRVSVDGSVVGVVAPLGTATIHGVRWGEYEVVLRFPAGHGATRTRLTHTTLPD